MDPDHRFFSVANLAAIQTAVEARIKAETGVPTRFDDHDALSTTMAGLVHHPHFGALLLGNTTPRDMELLNAEVVRRVTEPLMEPETAGQYWHQNRLYNTTRTGKREEKAGLAHLMGRDDARRWHREQVAEAKRMQAAYTEVEPWFARTHPVPSHDHTLRDL